MRETRHRRRLLPAVAGVLLGASCFAAEPAPPPSYLAFACDDSAGERRVLAEHKATWTIVETRALDARFGRAVYRVPVGHAALNRLRLEVNQVPYRLEFSADGRRWRALSPQPGPASPDPPFTTQRIAFTPAQIAAANASGQALFRLRPTGAPGGATLQLRRFRLDVSGPEVPPGFVRPSAWRTALPRATGPLMMLVGLIPVLAIRRRASWRAIGTGAALWAASVALKVIFAALTSGPVGHALHAAMRTNWANPVYWTVLGALTGVFECGIFVAAAPRLRRRVWSWDAALGLGLGFGAAEAILLGLIVTLTSGAGGEWSDLTAGPDALVPAFERLLTLPMHAAASMMALYAVLHGRWRWFWAAFVYKSAVDTVATWLAAAGLQRFASPWAMEATCFLPFALLGLALLYALHRRWASAADRAAPRHRDGAFAV